VQKADDRNFMEAQNKKAPVGAFLLLSIDINNNNVADRTGLEPATTRVTGGYSNQLNYRSI
jgi:hypothetical protein